MKCSCDDLSENRSLSCAPDCLFGFAPKLERSIFDISFVLIIGLGLINSVGHKSVKVLPNCDDSFEKDLLRSVS